MHTILKRGDRMARRPKKEKSTNSQTLREYIASSAEKFDVPLGTAMDMPSIELTQTSVLIERHHGITEYEPERICVAARDCVIKICGIGLEIRAMNATEIDIRGRIGGVEIV